MMPHRALMWHDNPLHNLIFAGVLLAVMGIALAIYEYRKRRKRKNTKTNESEAGKHNSLPAFLVQIWCKT